MSGCRVDLVLAAEREHRYEGGLGDERGGLMAVGVEQREDQRGIVYFDVVANGGQNVLQGAADRDRRTEQWNFGRSYGHQILGVRSR